MTTGATPPACPTCNGNGWLFSLPRGMNAFELGAEGIARNARKVSCWRCAVDRRASGTEAALLREFIECALYDATMEGPCFKGWNRSALDRLLPKVRAAVVPSTQDGDK